MNILTWILVAVAAVYLHSQLIKTKNRVSAFMNKAEQTMDKADKALSLIEKWIESIIK